MPAKSKKKKVVVDRKFLLNLANTIHSSKNRTFLRLCNGTLQNGPDPTNAKRPMHCGLGELYFAMTGRQPEVDGVDEGDVVDLAVDLSRFKGLREKADVAKYNELDKLCKSFDKFDISESLRDQLQVAVINEQYELDSEIDEDEREDDEHYFRMALDEIPEQNDDGLTEEVCSLVNYKDRSKRVASQIRIAASLLPK